MPWFNLQHPLYVLVWHLILYLPFSHTAQVSRSLSFGQGLVIPEYQHFNSIVDKQLTSIEFSIKKKTTGERNYWSQLYNFPQVGLTGQFTTLGNKQILGDEFALFPFIQFCLNRNEKLQFFQELGLGLGFVTKKFDLDKNYKNISIGSHWNVHFNFKMGVSFKVKERIKLDGGLSFTHFSNANMAEPNLGINALNVFLRVSHAQLIVQPTIRDLPEFKKFTEWIILPSVGGKHARALQNQLYPTASMSLECNRAVYRRIHFGIGADGFYDSSTKVEMQTPEGNAYQAKDQFRTGIHIAQEFVYSKFSLILQEGAYIILTDKVSNSPIYTKAIVRFKLSQNAILQVAMKSHLHILEYPEVGFGWLLK